jgi:hypothetical protein
MFAQVTTFVGPRSTEARAASLRSGKERINPAILADPFLTEQGASWVVLERSDGHLVVVSLANSQEALDHAGKVIMSTELLPGEDPALLTGPDSVEFFAVLDHHVSPKLGD